MYNFYTDNPSSLSLIFACCPEPHNIQKNFIFEIFEQIFSVDLSSFDFWLYKIISPDSPILGGIA